MHAAHDISCGGQRESNRGGQGQAPSAMDIDNASTSNNRDSKPASQSQGDGEERAPAAAAATAQLPHQPLAPLTLTVVPTTGGHFDIEAPRRAAVDELRANIARRLRVPPERICLLHRDRYDCDNHARPN